MRLALLLIMLSRSTVAFRAGARTTRVARLSMAAKATSTPVPDVSIAAAQLSAPAIERFVPPTKLPSKWVVFSDLHVRADTLPLCLQILRSVAAEARSRSAGVICLGDFWHSGALLSTRQLNAVLAELNKWGPDLPMLMIPGNHDQAMRGDPSPELHALTPLGLALPGNVHVFSRPTLLDDALWAPYGTSEAQLEAACAEAAAACAPIGGLSAVFCHADIVGGLMSEDRAATVGLPPAAFPAAPVRVYSGHYHKPHVVAEPTAKGRHIRYVGSPYQTSMAEAGQQKALLVLDAAAQWAVAEEVPLDAGPRHHVLRRPPTADLDALAPALRRGDRVLVLADDATDDASLAAFAEAGRSRGAAVELREAESPSMEMGAAVDVAARRRRRWWRARRPAAARRALWRVRRRAQPDGRGARRGAARAHRVRRRRLARGAAAAHAEFGVGAPRGLRLVPQAARVPARRPRAAAAAGVDAPRGRRRARRRRRRANGYHG